jgi:hypothetical protein
VLAPIDMYKGEEDQEDLNACNSEHSTIKRKSDQVEGSESEPRRTRGIHTNYRYLNDPFPNKEEAALIAINEGNNPIPI